MTRRDGREEYLVGKPCRACLDFDRAERSAIEERTKMPAHRLDGCECVVAVQEAKK